LTNITQIVKIKENNIEAQKVLIVLVDVMEVAHIAKEIDCTLQKREKKNLIMILTTMTKKQAKGNLGGFKSKEEAAQHGYTAVVIERISDGAQLTLNSDSETYSFSEELVKDLTKYTYTYERLMDDPRAKGKFKVLSWVKDLNPDKLSNKTGEKSV
jgi:hypothetical protein